ncbi:MAG: hypothetical protein E6J72_07020 [Deltaproteobacteria bacterium]|nr:MAG: hypothetical protein E6J72_07020 [Deltaproteobacteria bacterium]
MSAEAGTVPLERERRLVLAILEEAVRSYQHYAFATNRRGRRLFGETCEWFDSHDNTWIFSFENICYALDLDPDHIREGLTRWRQEQARRRPVVAAPNAAAAYRLRRAAG